MILGLSEPVKRRWMVWNAQALAEYENAPAILAIGQDITSLKRAQEQALQSERLAAIGQHAVDEEERAGADPVIQHLINGALHALHVH